MSRLLPEHWLPPTVVTLPALPPTREEFDAIKAEVEKLKAMLTPDASDDPG
jgi:hypothetical protein